MKLYIAIAHQGNQRGGHSRNISKEPIMYSKIFAGAAIALALVAAGCSSPTPLSSTASSASGAAAGSGAGAATVGTQPVAKSTVAAVVVHPLDDPKSPLAARSVYFDFDSYVVHASNAAILDNHGKYMLSHQTANLRLEGHADERGGREYNLALGQKRAEAALQSLKLLGVSDKRMEAISFGKEKPVGLGHDEESWSKNRRADLNYKTR